MEIIKCHQAQKLTDNGLLQLLRLCGDNLNILDLTETQITGERLSEYSRILPVESLLCNKCSNLSDRGLVQLLQLSGSTLKYLDISETNISGDLLYAYNGFLPCLLTLNCKKNCNLTGYGLRHLLRFGGRTLKSLNVSFTLISGEGLLANNITLPSLEDLQCLMCNNLNDFGLFEYLQVSGNTLKHLVLENTDVTGEFMSTYQVRLVKYSTKIYFKKEISLKIFSHSTRSS